MCPGVEYYPGQLIEHWTLVRAGPRIVFQMNSRESFPWFHEIFVFKYYIFGYFLAKDIC